MRPSSSHRSAVLALGAIGLVVAGVGGAVLWWRSGPVDPALIGRWQTTSDEAHGLVRTDVMDIARSGDVTVEQLTRGRGRFDASEGRWRLVTPVGTTVEGRYAMTAPGRVTLRGFPFGGEDWAREVMPDGGGPLAGRWRGTSPEATPGEAAFITDPDGRYRFAHTRTLTATLSARDGAWRVRDADGEVTVGRYDVGEGSLVVSEARGQTTWRRR